MKTVDKVNVEISDLSESVVSMDSKLEKKQIKSLKKKLIFLREVRLYLETYPNEDFVKKQKSQVATKISNCRDEIRKQKTKEAKAESRKAHSLTKLLSQEKFLNYILS